MRLCLVIGYKIVNRFIHWQLGRSEFYQDKYEIESSLWRRVFTTLLCSCVTFRADSPRWNKRAKIVLRDVVSIGLFDIYACVLLPFRAHKFVPIMLWHWSLKSLCPGWNLFMADKLYLYWYSSKRSFTSMTFTIHIHQYIKYMRND